MKKLLSLVFMFGIMAAMVSCEDDEVVPGSISISGVSASATIENLGTVGPETITLSAEDGLASVSITKGGAAYADSTFSNVTSATMEFSYTAVAADADQVIEFVFTITDTDGDTESATLVVAVGSAPLPLDPVVVTGLIEANTTWTANRIYELAGRVIVESGTTLTIEPGTIIKGREGQGSLASALIIARGAKIMAEGTAENPIIFTSILDNIAVGGEYVGNLEKEDNEKWGGLIILGSAPISAKGGDTQSAIEGLPADESYGLYGAVSADDFNAEDNSGVLTYVSIRHGGTLIGADNEINGLTLGGVGSGTTINNLEIFGTLDDGIEFFGGTVNVTNLLVVWQGDDGVDIDQNYSGTVDNFVVYHGDAVDTDEGLEIDGPENTLKDGKFTLKNGTIKNDGVEGSAADLKSDAQGTIDNVVFSGYPTGKGLIKVEGEYTVDCEARTGAQGTFNDALDKLLENLLIVTGSTFEGVKVYSKVDEDKNPICGSVPAADQTAVEGKVVSDAAATGADTSVFGWSAAVASGLTL